jgi:hypothetical protein
VLMDGSWNGLVVERILGSRPRLTDIAVRCHGFLDVIVREPSAKPNSLVSQV